MPTAKHARVARVKNAPKKNKAEKKKGRGRPTLYKPEYCSELIQFFEREPYTMVTTESMTEYFKDGRIKKVLERKKPMANTLPTVFRFCDHIGIGTKTFYTWVERHSEFAHAFTRAKEIVKESLTTLGLAGVSPPAAFIFVAANMTDMKPQGVGDFEPGAMIVPVIVRRKEDQQELPAGPSPKPRSVRVKVMDHARESKS